MSAYFNQKTKKWDANFSYRDFENNSRKKELKKGIQISGVKDIRLHDLRHSHVSLLIHMGYTAFEIAKEWGIKVSGLHTIMHICFRECRKTWRRDWMRREIYLPRVL